MFYNQAKKLIKTLIWYDTYKEIINLCKQGEKEEGA